MSAPLPLPVAEAPSPAVRRRPLLDVSPGELRTWLADRGQPPMRVNQIRRWVLERRATSFDAMSDLPKSLRLELAEAFDVFGTAVDRHLTASDDTHKLLLRLATAGRSSAC